MSKSPLSFLSSNISQVSSAIREGKCLLKHSYVCICILWDLWLLTDEVVKANCIVFALQCLLLHLTVGDV